MTTDSEPQSDAPEAGGAAPEAKRDLISLPFILIVGALGVAGYFAGPWIMTQVMYQQELAKSQAPPEFPDEDSEGPSLDGASAPASGEPGGEGRGGRGGGGRGNFDPEEIFDTRDEDGNGKLEGEEISERMQDRVEQLDTDKDGAISKDEFVTGMENFRGRRGGGGGGRGGGGRGGRPASDDSSDEGETPEGDADAESDSEGEQDAAADESSKSEPAEGESGDEDESKESESDDS